MNKRIGLIIPYSFLVFLFLSSTLSVNAINTSNQNRLKEFSLYISGKEANYHIFQEVL